MTTTHTIKIKNDVFDPVETTNVKTGDKIKFKLDNRTTTARVNAPDGLFEGDDNFDVGTDGKDKTVKAGQGQYGISANKSPGGHGKAPREDQMNGKIIIIP